MDKFKAFFLLLLTLTLNVQLSSSAPMFGAFAEEPSLEGLTSVEEEESEEKHIPVVPEETALSREKQPAEEVIPVTDKEPEPAPIEAVSEEASPDISTAEVTAATPPETESPEEHNEEESAPEIPPISVIPLEASEDEAPENGAEAELLPITPKKETSVIPAEPQTGEAAEIQQPDPEEQKDTIAVISADTNEEEEEHITEEEPVGGEGEDLGETPPEHPAVEDLVPIIPTMASEDDVPEDNKGTPEGNTEEDSATGEGSLPSTPEDEDSLVPVPVEHEAEGEGQEITGPQEPPVDVSAPEATIPIVPGEASEDEASEDNADAPELILLTDPEDNTEGEHLPSTPEKETSVIPAEPQTGEGAEIQQSDPEEQKETIPVISADTNEEEEELTEDEAVGGEVAEENTEEDPTTGESLPSLPSTPEDENFFVPVPVEHEAEGEGQEITGPQEPPADVSAPEATIPIVPDEASQDEASEDNADAPELILLTDPEDNTEGEHLPSTPEKETSIIPVEPQTGEGAEIQQSDPEEQKETIPVISADTNEEEEEHITEDEAVGGEGEDLGETAPEHPAVEDLVLIIPGKTSEDEAPEDNEGAPEKMIVIDHNANAGDEVPDQMGPVEEETTAEESAPEDSVILPATDEECKEEEAAAIFPIELQTEGEDELETAAEGKTLQESVEDLFVIDISEEEPVAPKENTEEEEPVTGEKSHPSTPEEEDSLVSVPVEHEAEGEGQEETAPQEPPVDVSALETTITIVSEDDADASELILLRDPEDNAEGEHLPTTPKDDISVVVFPIELETEVEDQVEAAAEETTPQESTGEDPVVVVLTNEEKETTATAASATEDVAQEGPVPVVAEENTEEDPTTGESLPSLPSTPEDENFFVPVPVEHEAEGEGQEITGPQEPPADVSAPDATIPIVPDEASQDEASEDNADAPELILLTDPEDNTEGEHLPSTTEKETSIIPPELQTGEASEIQQSDPEEQKETIPVISADISEEEEEHIKEDEPVGGEGEDLGETAPEDPNVEDSVLIIPSITSEDEAPEDNEGAPEKMIVIDHNGNAEDEVADQMGPVEEETTAEESPPKDSVVIFLPTDEPKEEEACAIFPKELQIEGEDELETAAEESTLQESVEDLFVIDISEEEPVAPEENTEEDPTTGEESHPSTPEEEDSLVPVPVEHEAEGEGQEETAPQEPPVDVSAPEATIPIVPEGASEDEVSEDNADASELILLTDPEDNTGGEHLPTTPEDDISVVVFPIELETEVEDQVEAAAEETTLQESAGEDLVVIVLTNEEQETTATAASALENVVQERPVPKAPEENNEEDPAIGEESTPEEEVSLVQVPAEPETEGESQKEAAPEDPIIQHKAEDFNVAATMKNNDPVGPLNGGTMLGAALLTQMSLIIIGFVGTNI
ncbi:cell surface glycoprotein 1-like [Mugil cephalus]|uniref:cell surface glycoprotein 1-like n=1 Tax=Mugil cephalus TaxID=48193 RepID=UPI001FB6C506|nr:cell surface glycoprotein 1-like [Mugil cephalus]